MNLNHYKNFIVLADQLRFGQAAQRLHLAQPAAAPFRDFKSMVAYARANPGKLNAAFNAALKHPEAQAKLAAAGWMARGGSPSDMAAAIGIEKALFGPAVKEANIRME